MYLVETKVRHPALRTWKYPFVGDSIVPMVQRVIIDVDAGRVTRLKIPRAISACARQIPIP